MDAAHAPRPGLPRPDPGAALPRLPLRAKDGRQVKRLPVTYEVLKDLGLPLPRRALAADPFGPAQRPPEKSLRERVSALVGSSGPGAPSELDQVLKAVHGVIAGEYHPKALGEALLRRKFGGRLEQGYPGEFMAWLKDGKSAAASPEFVAQAVRLSADVLASYEEVARLAAEKHGRTPDEALASKQLYTCAYGMLNQELDRLLPVPEPDTPFRPSPYAVYAGSTAPELHPEVRRTLLTDFYATLDAHLGHGGDSGGTMTVQRLRELVDRFAAGAREAIAQETLKVRGRSSPPATARAPAPSSRPGIRHPAYWPPGNPFLR